MACLSESTTASSEEEKKEQRLIDVMFLCDEWKSSKGGLSTFNREFAINLAETTTGSLKIHCYVSQSDDRDREDAKQHGVNLINAETVPGSRDPLDWLKIPHPTLQHPQVVIGHGRKLGTPACHFVRTTRCKWIQFVHVFCEDLGKYKKTTSAATDTMEENEEKHKMEIELCKAADAVVAVGSRLQQKYSRSLLNVKVEIITPGIFEKFSSESKLAVNRSVVKKFNLFMFGRATFEDLSLKGYDIVANAIGSLGKNFELTFVGSPPGEHQNVEQWFLNNTRINRNQLTIRGYCSEQEELKMMFYQSDLVALPSRTEGFGLVPLEAISAGVPILVSGESGIAEALQEVEGGKAVIVESDEDADEWAQRIREIFEESVEEREANAMKLRENYRKAFSWRTECERFKAMIERLMQKEHADDEVNITTGGSEYYCESGKKRKLTATENLRQKCNTQMIADKSVADSVEGLIGAYLISCGYLGALRFMKFLWLKLLPEVDSDDDIDSLAENSKSGCYARFWPDQTNVTATQGKGDMVSRLTSGLENFENKAISYNFQQKLYLVEALTHASYHENRVTPSYERLEFLGDALLDFLVTQHLYFRRVNLSPGQLTDIRQALVNNNIFATLAVKHDYHKFLKHMSPKWFQTVKNFVDRVEDEEEERKHNRPQTVTADPFIIVSEEEEEGIEAPKVLGDIFESVAGAIFLDSGMDLTKTWGVYYRMMKPYIDHYSVNIPRNPIRHVYEEDEKADFGKAKTLDDGKIQCTLRVHWGEFNGKGTNKKIAKATAAKLAIEALEKNSSQERVALYEED